MVVLILGRSQHVQMRLMMQYHPRETEPSRGRGQVHIQRIITYQGSKGMGIGEGGSLSLGGKGERGVRRRGGNGGRERQHPKG